MVAGVARGLRLDAPPGTSRPLGDRLKEAVFAIVEADLRGRAFLDLFAGSGGGGIEALSRGASRAVFVERDPNAIATIARNLHKAGFGDRAVVRRGAALDWLRSAGRTGGPFGVVLADPPYDDAAALIGVVAEIAAAGPDGILAGTGVVVAKHDRRAGPGVGIGLLASVRERRFGESVVTFLRWTADQEAR